MREYLWLETSAHVLLLLSVIRGFLFVCVCVHTAQHRQEAMGIGCDVIRVEIEEGLSKDHLLETFINCGRTFITLLDLLILYQSFYKYQMVGVYNQLRMLCCVRVPGVC